MAGLCGALRARVKARGELSRAPLRVYRGQLTWRRGRAHGRHRRRRFRHRRAAWADRLSAASRCASAPSLHGVAGGARLRAGTGPRAFRASCSFRSQGHSCAISSANCASSTSGPSTCFGSFCRFCCSIPRPRSTVASCWTTSSPILILAVVAVLMTTAAGGLAVWGGLLAAAGDLPAGRGDHRHDRPQRRDRRVPRGWRRRRLTSCCVEGESLLNDAAAIALFTRAPRRDHCNHGDQRAAR